MHKASALLLLLGCVIVWPVAGQQRDPYVWVATGRLITPRANACAVSLGDGRVLVAGGDGVDGALSSVEWYGDDAVFHAAAPMARARSQAACAALADGRVLVAGGGPGGDAGPGAEVYDPVADRWQAAANEPLPRWGQTASVLSDGRVLLAGGESDAGATAALEVFDPSTNSFELLSATLTTPHTLHSAAVLQDDHVLIVGGSDGRLFLNTADLVDLETGEVAPLPNLAKARARHSSIALLDGTVLVAGGMNGDGDMSSSLLYLPGEKRFLDGPALNTARSSHAALRIPGNGNVLLIGGSSGGVATASTEVFDFVLRQFVPAGPLTLARLGLAAAAQGDQGVVLAVGGATAQGPVAACGTLTAPTLTSTKRIYLATETATLNGAHYASQESVVFTVQKTALNGGVSSISIPSLITTSTGTFQTTIAPQSAGSTVLVGARGVHTNLTAATSYFVGAATTTTLSITPAGGAISAQQVTLSAQVHPASVVGPLRGTLSFFDGSTLLGSISDGNDGGLAVDANQNGSGTLVVAFGGGTRSLHAEFASKSFYTDSATLAATYPVTKRVAQMGVTASPDPPRIGGSIVLQVLVGAGGGVPLIRPTGAILWAEVTAQGTTTLGVTALTGAGGFAGLTNVTASLTIPAGNTAGTRLFKATYSGDDNYLGRVDGINVSVLRSLPALSPVGGVGVDQFFPIPPNSVFLTAYSYALGTVITFTKVNGASPTGKVFLRSGSATLASANVPLPAAGTSSSKVIFQFAFTAAGALNLRAEYEGDANFDTVDTAVIPITVVKVTPHMQITYPSTVGLHDPNIQLAVQMDQKTGAGEILTDLTPTGTIQVFRNSETTPVATATLAAGGGGVNVANFQFPRPPSSGETFRLVYSGDSSFTAETATTGSISSVVINDPANDLTPTMILTYRPHPDSISEVTVRVRLAITQANGSITFRDETGVVQAFFNDATTALDTVVLGNGQVFMLLAPPLGSPTTFTYRFVYIGPDPTVQGITGLITSF
jgi:hypothetical protein